MGRALSLKMACRSMYVLSGTCPSKQSVVCASSFPFLKLSDCIASIVLALDFEFSLFKALFLKCLSHSLAPPRFFCTYFFTVLPYTQESSYKEYQPIAAFVAANRAEAIDALRNLERVTDGKVTPSQLKCLEGLVGPDMQQVHNNLK